MLELPEIGRLKIGKKVKSERGTEYPTSVDYFIPTGKYAGLFTKALGEKPQTIAIVFPSDEPAIVCNERFEYRNDKGELVARGDGRIFEVWNGHLYAPYSVVDYPDIMEKIAHRYPTKRADNWDETLTLQFIVPAVRGVVGLWKFTTKGKASSIRNIRESFDAVQLMRGTVCKTVFDLSVQFAKSNKPDTNSKYPIVSLVANDNRVAEIRQMLQANDSTGNLLITAE